MNFTVTAGLIRSLLDGRAIPEVSIPFSPNCFVCDVSASPCFGVLSQPTAAAIIATQPNIHKQRFISNLYLLATEPRVFTQQHRQTNYW